MVIKLGRWEVRVQRRRTRKPGLGVYTAKRGDGALGMLFYSDVHKEWRWHLHREAKNGTAYHYGPWLKFFPAKTQLTDDGWVLRKHEYCKDFNDGK